MRREQYGGMFEEIRRQAFSVKKANKHAAKARSGISGCLTKQLVKGLWLNFMMMGARDISNSAEKPQDVEWLLRVFAKEIGMSETPLRTAYNIMFYVGKQEAWPLRSHFSQIHQARRLLFTQISGLLLGLEYRNQQISWKFDDVYHLRELVIALKDIDAVYRGCWTSLEDYFDAEVEGLDFAHETDISDGDMIDTPVTVTGKRVRFALCDSKKTS